MRMIRGAAMEFLFPFWGKWECDLGVVYDGSTLVSAAVCTMAWMENRGFSSRWLWR